MAEQKKITRRNFFAGIGAVAAAGTAVSLTAPVAGLTGQAADTPESEPEGKSYRLTDHIRRYYRTTTL